MFLFKRHSPRNFIVGGEMFAHWSALPASLAWEAFSAIAFVGGKDYVPLFCSLTSGVRGRRTVFFNSQTPPEAPGCVPERYVTTTKTN